MISLSEEQIFERYSSLPIDLISALNSGDVSEDIQQIGNTRNLSPEKIEDIGFIVGSIILGFIHPNDLSREIQSELGLTAPIAESIAQEIDQKIFVPIRQDLEKNYQPAAAVSTESAIRKEEKEIKSVGIPIIKTPPAAPDASIPVAPKIVSVPPSVSVPVVPSVPIAPKAPLIPAIPTTQIPPTPKIQQSVAVPIKTESTPKPLDLNELAKLAQQSSKAVNSSLSEQPFIIHKETAAEPVFKKNLSFSPLSWFKKTESKKTLETPKAEMEMFGSKPAEQKESAVVKTETQKQKVVHYSQAEISTPFGKPVEMPKSFPSMPAPKKETKIGVQIPVRRIEFSKPSEASLKKPEVELPKPSSAKTLDFLESVVKPTEAEPINKSFSEPIKLFSQKPEIVSAESVAQPIAIEKPFEKSEKIPEEVAISDKVFESDKLAVETDKSIPTESEKNLVKTQDKSEAAAPVPPAAKTAEPTMINLDSFKITKK